MEWIQDNWAVIFQWFGVVIAIATFAVATLDKVLPASARWDNKLLKVLNWITANVLSLMSLKKAPKDKPE